MAYAVTNLADNSHFEDKNLRWNYRIGVVNGVAFRVVDTLVNPSLVMVVCLSYLTDNPVLLGMPMALWSGGFMIAQLATTGYVRGLTRALPMYKAVSVVRALMWLPLVAVPALTADPAALIVTTVAFLILYPIVWGVSGLAFYEVVSKVIPPRLRAPFFSWRMALGGLFALGASGFVERVLAPESSLDFPRNYALIFAAAAIVTLLGLQTFHMLREPVSEAHRPERHGLRAGLAEVRAALREDRLFARFVWARVATLLAAGTAPLIIVYAQTGFGLPLSAAPLFLMADTLVGLVTVAASGWLSLRLGNRWLALISAGLGIAVFGLLVAAGIILPGTTLVLPYFLLVFILLSVMNGTGNVSFSALNLNIPPVEQRPLYVGLSNTIFGVATYLNLAQGVIVTLAGYGALFGLAVILSGVGLWLVLGLYDPTERREVCHGRAGR